MRLFKSKIYFFPYTTGNKYVLIFLFIYFITDIRNLETAIYAR